MAPTLSYKKESSLAGWGHLLREEKWKRRHGDPEAGPGLPAWAGPEPSPDRAA